MSLKLGTQDISGISQNTKYNAHHLLDFKWTDCIMNDVSWLRADTFSWQSGDVYTSAYNHLVADLQGTTSETETIGSYTITFYRADDGHKICLTDQETTVLNIYNETGIAWYYIVDTTNTQFKLPRTKYGFEGLRNNVGDMIDESLPNITGDFTASERTDTTSVPHGTDGVFSTTAIQSWGLGGSGGTARDQRINFNASNSSSTYQDGAPVQEYATQMYLYFYVGDYSQTALEQTAGLNSELFNGKVDLNLDNMNPSQTAKDTIIGWGMPDYSSGISIPYTSINSSANQYTAPCDGVIIGKLGNTGAAFYYAYVNNNSFPIAEASNAYNQVLPFTIPLSKNDTFYINGVLSTTEGTFFPLKGAN